MCRRVRRAACQPLQMNSWCPQAQVRRVPGKMGKSPHDFRRLIPPHLTQYLPSEGIDLMYVSKTRLAIGTSLMALTFGMLGGGTAYAFQEHMFNARNDLQQAVNELNQAEHDKGGHRKNAVGLVQQAINQVIRALWLVVARPSRGRYRTN